MIPGTKRDGRAKGGDGRRERGETGRQGETDGSGVEERRAGWARDGGIRPHEKGALLKAV